MKPKLTREDWETELAGRPRARLDEEEQTDSGAYYRLACTALPHGDGYMGCMSFGTGIVCAACPVGKLADRAEARQRILSMEGETNE